MDTRVACFVATAGERAVLPSERAYFTKTPKALDHALKNKIPFSVLTAEALERSHLDNFRALDTGGYNASFDPDAEERAVDSVTRVLTSDLDCKIAAGASFEARARRSERRGRKREAALEAQERRGLIGS